MSRTDKHFRSAPAVLAVVLLGMAAPGFGQDAGNPSSQSGAKGSPSATQPGSASQSGSDPATQPSGTAPSNSGKPAPVCFKLTGRCVEPASKAAKGSVAKDQGTSPQGTGASQPAAAGKPLNLSAPDVRSVVPADELSEPLPSNEQITEIQEAGTVSVKSDKELAEVPLGFGALWWALNHPSQAWRILTPVE